MNLFYSFLVLTIYLVVPDYEPEKLDPKFRSRMQSMLAIQVLQINVQNNHILALTALLIIGLRFGGCGSALCKGDLLGILLGYVGWRGGREGGL